MTRLGDILSFHDLPAAELHAARLDGEVFRVDDCFCPVDQIEQPRHRAGSLAALVPDRLIAEQRTAAWIWGVTAAPPSVHQFCASIGARVRPIAAVRMAVREVVMTDGAVIELAGLQLTTVLRTIIDLARFSTAFRSHDLPIIRDLMRLGSLDAEDCRREIDNRRNLPNKKVALARIREASSGYPLFTR